MLRNFARLSGVSSVRIWAPRTPIQTAARATAALGKGPIASFHKAIHPAFDAVTSNAAVSPSTPLPPPMVTSSQDNDNDSRVVSSTPANDPTIEVEKAEVSQTATTTTTTTAVAVATAADQQGEEVEEREERDESTFAEFVPVSSEQEHSLNSNPILHQLVNTIMMDGKKARAQRFVADAMLEIRSRTHSDPYQIVLDALELASPILKLTPIKKGSKMLQVPTPMTERQRRRRAIMWILGASDKRKGEKRFKDRLASEFLAVVNGNSGALLKKNQQHKMALANRANASLKY
ncbi:hypothetical protein BGZ65_010453 [Modicella reniformis]|uniref:Small ribosomal subunit protein uS7 domain-containing protein n=1 Tax=Modicella reniformis TaxID=1440133 RepID=A0A9P6MKF9_9FUNG|nr:hypothetical protein BGZ65_010453 [Modicella reniformis]